MHLIPSLVLAALVAISAGCGDTTPDTAPDTTPDTAPDTTSDTTPDITPDTTSDTTPDPDTAPDTTPDTTPDPTSDDDGDGVPYAEERRIGTDPLDPDTDHDGAWDGWELAAGTDPLDPASFPTLPTYTGTAYALDLVELTEPAPLRLIFGNILANWPPLLALLDGPDPALTLRGGIARQVSLGPDLTPNTPDDVYALLLGALDPKTGALRIDLAGAREADTLTTTAEAAALDLSTVSEITYGVVLSIENPTLTATFTPTNALTPVQLTGTLTRSGVAQIIDHATLPVPVDLDTAMGILDPDGDGLIPVDLALRGRPVQNGGWALDAELPPPAPRPEATCCPSGLTLGDPIDPALTLADQGLQPGEEELGMAVIRHALTKTERLDFIATQRLVDGTRKTFVYSPRGHVAITRNHPQTDTPATPAFTVSLLADLDDTEGTPIALDDPRNPIMNQDPSQLSDFDSFISKSEPFTPDSGYRALGYSDGDPRVRRVPTTHTTYPFGYERLTQLFDDPRAPDLIIEPLSYTGGGGNHGQLSALQSRSPLILSGAGVTRPTLPEAGFSLACAGPCTPNAPSFILRDDAARLVDIAPTVAHALGSGLTTGVGPNGRLSDSVYLAWQDGHPRTDVLTTTRPRYVLVIVNDGLTSMELLRETLSDASPGLDAYRELMQRGVTFRHGAISNYPSNTYPSHNVIGAGAWSGHHGLVDNAFYERALATLFRPITQLFGTEVYLHGAHPNLPTETIHEALNRSFGGAWDKNTNPNGNFTAALNDPSTRGATLATLERRFPPGYAQPTAQDTLTVNGVPYPLPTVPFTDSEGLLDNSTVLALSGLFLDNPGRGFPIPRYTVVNFASTDAAGHRAGPHSDAVQAALAATNARLRIVIALLKAAGIYDETLIVLTADHGMELKDPSTRGDLLAGLPNDIALLRTETFIYIKQLTINITTNSATEIRIHITDADNAAPVPGTRVVLEDTHGQALTEGVTDPDGWLTLDPTQAHQLRAEHAGFSTALHPIAP